MSVLQVGGVKSTLSTSALSDVSSLQQLLSSSIPTSMSKAASIYYEVSQLILQIRNFYNARDWNALDTLLSSCKPESILFLQDKCPETIKELDNCKWLVSYHKMIAALINIITTPTFSIVKIETGDKSVLLQGIDENKVVLKDAKKFRLEDEPVFASTFELASTIVSLKTLVFDMKELEEVKLYDLYHKYSSADNDIFFYRFEDCRTSQSHIKAWTMPLPVK